VLEFSEHVTRSTFVKSCVVSRVVVRSRFVVDSCHSGEMMAFFILLMRSNLNSSSPEQTS
jgi:hypothetical protein